MRLSGPVSAYVFDVVTAKYSTHTSRLYLFGDHHFSFKNLCAKEDCLEADGCIEVADFIESLSTMPEVETDVFLEVPWEKIPILNRKDSLINARSRDTDSKKFRQHAGVLGLLFSRFRTRLYQGPIITSPNKTKNQDSRFHYVDVRTESIISGLPPTVDKFAKMAPTSEDVRHTIRGIMFRQGKVAKQFHKLAHVKDVTHLQVRVHMYLDTQLDKVVCALRDELGYDSVPTDSSVSDDRGSRILERFSPIFVLGIRTLVMDAYLLCRVLFYMFMYQGHHGILHKRSVVYAGEMHINFLADFFRQLDGVVTETHSVGKKISANSKHPNSASRCVPLSMEGL
jgi:hypothetical protein